VHHLSDGATETVAGFRGKVGGSERLGNQSQRRVGVWADAGGRGYVVRGGWVLRTWLSGGRGSWWQAGAPAELVQLGGCGTQGSGQRLDDRLVGRVAVAALQLGNVGVVDARGGGELADGEAALDAQVVQVAAEAAARA
jgi:hypothetical protein